MYIFQSLKLHYFAYRRVFIIFFLSLFALSCASLYFLNDRIDNLNHYVFIIAIVASIIFSFCLGIYEYNKLVFHYVYLKVHHKEFFYSTVVFALINALLQLINLVIMLFIISAFTEINQLIDLIKNLKSYFLYFFALVLVFSVSNLLTLLLRRIRNIKFIVYLLLLISLSFFFYNLVDFLNNNLLVLLINQANVYIIVSFIVSNSIVNFLVYLKFNNLKK